MEVIDRNKAVTQHLEEIIKKNINKKVKIRKTQNMWVFMLPVVCVHYQTQKCLTSRGSNSVTR